MNYNKRTAATKATAIFIIVVFVASILFGVSSFLYK